MLGVLYIAWTEVITGKPTQCVVVGMNGGLYVTHISTASWVSWFHTAPVQNDNRILYILELPRLCTVLSGAEFIRSRLSNAQAADYVTDSFDTEDMSVWTHTLCSHTQTLFQCTICVKTRQLEHFYKWIWRARSRTHIHAHSRAINCDTAAHCVPSHCSPVSCVYVQDCGICPLLTFGSFS